MIHYCMIQTGCAIAALCLLMVGQIQLKSRLRSKMFLK